MEDLKTKLTFSKLKEYLTTLKDSAPLILILISVFGGTWQLLQLGSISFSYIRFFSLTQLIQDGLILVIVLITFIAVNIGFLLAVVSYFFVFAEIIPQRTKNKIQNRIFRIQPLTIIRYIFSVFSLINLIYILWIITLPLTEINIRFFLLNIFILLFVFVIINQFFEYTSIKKNTVDSGFYIIICISTLLLFFRMAAYFNSKYLIPTDLKNFDIVIEKMKTQNPNAKIEILYFNDKYLFTKIVKENIIWYSSDTIDKIEIINFEDIPTKY